MSEIDTSQARSYLDFGGLEKLRGQAKQDSSKAVQETAVQFEAYFTQQMLKQMRATVEKSDLVDTGTTDMYQDLMDKEVALKISKNGGLGLAKMLQAKMQEQVTPPSTQSVLQNQKAGLPLIRPAESIPLPTNNQTPTFTIQSNQIQSYELNSSRGKMNE